jgi:hypothetical protein
MMTGVYTKKCVWCGEQGIVQIEEMELYKYLRGTPANEAFVSLPVGLRNQFLTGTHPECWEKYRDEDEDYERMRDEQWLK